MRYVGIVWEYAAMVKCAEWEKVLADSKSQVAFVTAWVILVLVNRCNPLQRHCLVKAHSFWLLRSCCIMPTLQSQEICYTMTRLVKIKLFFTLFIGWWRGTGYLCQLGFCGGSQLEELCLVNTALCASANSSAGEAACSGVVTFCIFRSHLLGDQVNIVPAHAKRLCH